MQDQCALSGVPANPCRLPLLLHRVPHGGRLETDHRVVRTQFRVQGIENELTCLI